MNTMIDSVTQFLSVLTVLANILTVLLLVALVSSTLKTKKKFPILLTIRTIAYTWAIHVSFLVALVSMVGSLFYSEIARYEPCVLCWYQRIVMYPLVALFGVSLLKKERTVIISYAIPLIIIGIGISGFHSIEQSLANPMLPCSAIGYAASCTKFFFKTFGYITIPVMALSAFSLIIMLLLTKKAQNK